MFKNALVSVTDKTGLAEFLKPLVAQGVRVVSTGGTAKYLRDNHIPVTEIQEQTGYPEVMDGRVRTLHPRVYMPILARSWVAYDFTLLTQEGLKPFDLVICNLYKFSNYVGKNLPDRELVEHIDIGGPSLLRASAKNFDRIVVLCDPQDYARGTAALNDQKIRRELAAKVFQHVSQYDQLIFQELSHTQDRDSKSAATAEQTVSHRTPAFAPHHVVKGTLKQTLRYGENPHQLAGWYQTDAEAHGWHQAEILQGKELSYNNLLDLEASVATLRNFCLPTCVVVKHNNSCGVASDAELSAAVQNALAADPVSSFGGIVALNREVDLNSATALADLFLECIVAPDFSAEALSLLGKKKNLRLLRWRSLLKTAPAVEIRSITGGFLAQQTDGLIDWKDSWTIHPANGDVHSVEAFKTDLLFAFRIVAGLKSNAIALAQDQQTRGLGMGQVNRVDSVQQASARMKNVFKTCDKLVMASDAFFPFPDSIDLAHAANVKWIIQPGGSKNDEAVFKRAKELGIGLVITGERHFRH